MSNPTKTTLEKIAGFDVLRVYGTHTWDEACALPAQVQGHHDIDDWVLPDRVTLAALAGISEGVEGWHWSASPYVGDSDHAWGVFFVSGYVSSYCREYYFQARLVRASQCFDIGRAAQIKSVKEVGIAAIEPITSTAIEKAETARGQPVAYLVGRTLHLHEGRGVNDVQLYTTPQAVVVNQQLTAEPAADIQVEPEAKLREKNGQGMSELIDRLTTAAQQHKGTDLGGLLQWAVLHIQDQDGALAEAREEFETEQAERIRMEQAIHKAKSQMQTLVSELDCSRPVNIQLAKDHAPHINVMAFHGVEPYSKKGRKK